MSSTLALASTGDERTLVHEPSPTAFRANEETR
jgi:hypothetical protein